MDVASFSGNLFWESESSAVALTDEEVLLAFGTFATYWNDAHAAITLSVVAGERDCCTSLSEYGTGCEECYGDEVNDLFYFEGDAYELSEGFDDGAAAFTPNAYTEVDGHRCLVAKDVIVTSGYYDTWNGDAASSSDWCPYQWKYPYLPNEHDNCSDGDDQTEKAFKDTLVHEFGHVVGIGHQPSFPESAVPSGGGCTGCSYDTIGRVDATCLIELYDVACGGGS